jgi:hypothetical protein
LQKWLIWTQITNEWVGMDKTPYSDSIANTTYFWISILQDLSNGIIKIPISTSFNPSNLVSKL